MQDMSCLTQSIAWGCEFGSGWPHGVSPLSFTMAIPPFDNQGLLPLGAWFDYWRDALIYQGHDSSLDEVKEAFVTGTKVNLLHVARTRCA